MSRMIERLRHLGHAVADWCSFQMGTLSICLHPPHETPVDRAIREEGERLRKAFPWSEERGRGNAIRRRLRQPPLA
jgi:hypothetical protein